jgi:hypothetical protein
MPVMNHRTAITAEHPIGEAVDCQPMTRRPVQVSVTFAANDGPYQVSNRGKLRPITAVEWRRIEDRVRRGRKPAKGYPRNVPDPMADSQSPIGWTYTFTGRRS